MDDSEVVILKELDEFYVANWCWFLDTFYCK